MTHTLYGPTGAPLLLTSGNALEETGEIDTFNRPNGPLGDGWTDASTIYGTDIFDALTIVNREVTFVATHPNIYGTIEEDDTNFLVGHFFAARDIGVSDGFEVGLQYRTTDLDDLAGQISPCGLCINLEDADTAWDDVDSLHLGLGPLWDIGASWATYIQNVFRTETTIDDVFDPGDGDHDYYEKYGPDPDNPEANSTLLPGPFTQIPGLNTIAFRVLDGGMSSAWNNKSRTRLSLPSAVPSWAEGNTWAGIHIIWAGWKPGTASIAQDPVVTPHTGRITRWWWRPIDRHFR